MYWNFVLKKDRDVNLGYAHVGGFSNLTIGDLGQFYAGGISPVSKRMPVNENLIDTMTPERLLITHER